jgi:hypothetical protein
LIYNEAILKNEDNSKELGIEGGEDIYLEKDLSIRLNAHVLFKGKIVIEESFEMMKPDPIGNINELLKKKIDEIEEIPHEYEGI